MRNLQSVGGLLLGLCVFAGLALLVVGFLRGFAEVAALVFPWLVSGAWIAFALCLVVFLPLAALRFTRPAAVWGFFVSSYVIGTTIWLLGFFVTLTLWGWAGIIIGMLLGGVGVVPLAVIAASIKGWWWPVVAVLILGSIVSIATRVVALTLATAVDRRAAASELA